MKPLYIYIFKCLSKKKHTINSTAPTKILLFADPIPVIKIQHALVALRDRMHRHFPIFHSPSFRQSTFWPWQLIRRPTRLQLTAARWQEVHLRRANFFYRPKKAICYRQRWKLPCRAFAGWLGAKSDSRDNFSRNVGFSLLLSCELITALGAAYKANLISKKILVLCWNSTGRGRKAALAN